MLFLCNMEKWDSSKWLPTSRKEMEIRGWDSADVILFSGDAYVDHPSFGTAVIGRVAQAAGLRVAIVPQPNWRDDLRDFRKLGRPNLFFAITAGCMDSMVNHYTANRRRRSDDAYTAGGKAGQRPDYATIVYSKIVKELYPDIPLIIGGIEASLRRITHYDYWSDKLMPSILVDSGADLLFYGMGEKSLTNFIQLVQRGIDIKKLTNIPQTAFQREKGQDYATQNLWEEIELASHEACLSAPKAYAQNFRIIEEESNKYAAATIIQKTGNKTIVVNPPYPPASPKEIDTWYDLPYTRLPHPKYKGKVIPAYEMIRHSVTIHRGCFGGCAFCAISAHQGKYISSRSSNSIINEIHAITQMPDFKGHISDLGGPSANMYQMNSEDTTTCKRCKNPSCIFPVICKNLKTDHTPLLELYMQASKIAGVKRISVSSGIRYDLLLHRCKHEAVNLASQQYMETLIKNHVSGRLKVAP
ncbi:MAG: YgiQ family radical SAM protein, partial [Prolixibacteraceae bacterium]|nr:YgiQ family radical SAM protein [Prolixibacteraceae bacterium]